MGIEKIVGMNEMVNKELEGVKDALGEGIIVRMKKKEVGEVDKLMKLENDRDGRDSNGGQPADAE